MKTIAIIGGGDSPEYQISIKSAIEVQKALDPDLYETFVITIRGTDWYWNDSDGCKYDIDKNDFSLTTGKRKIIFDAVFIAIHGTPGENGLMQGYFDMLGIKYTSCNAFCSALTFNKQACKLFLKDYGIKMADAVLLRTGTDIDTDSIIHKTGLPCFVKPDDSGSSFGVSKVKNADELIPAIEKAFTESDSVLVESFIQGREVACGVVKTQSRSKTIILPVTEIISKNEFFDYEAKYTPGMSDEVTPAQMNEKTINAIQEQSSLIYDLLGCSGLVRVDFIVQESTPCFLEINTVPGMTKESIVPKQAKAAGIDIKDIYSMIIEDVL